MGNPKGIERFFGMTAGRMNRRERGQILLLVALTMTGLLLASGMAVDAGFLMMRKAQLDRAVDAAALAGAPVAVPGTGALGPANARGLQLLAANGFVISNPTLQRVPGPGTALLDFSTCSNGNLPEVGSNVGAVTSPVVVAPGTVPAPINYYCGQYTPGTMPGAVRYRVVARYNVPLFFMPIIGFNNVPLTSDATGEYYAMVDMYASDTAEYGLLQTATLSLFGPDLCTDYGDPFTPFTGNSGAANPDYSVLNGVYTYRIAIPPTYTYKTIRIEIFDPSSGNSSPEYDNTAADGDPIDSYVVWNSATGGSANLLSASNSGNTDRKDTDTMIPTAPNVDPNNAFWFIRADENRGDPTFGVCNEPTNYAEAYETDTLFRLYYQQQTAAGQFQEVDLAYYRSGRDIASDPKRATTTAPLGVPPAGGTGEVIATDMKWVSPGAPAAERNTAYNCTSPNTPVMGPCSPPTASTYTADAEPTTAVENCDTWRNNQTVPIGMNPPGNTADVSTAVSCSTPNGQGNFIVNLEAFTAAELAANPGLAALGTLQETPDIYVDPGTGWRYLYLQVRGLQGGTENGYQLWAGPSNLEEPDSRAPSNVNARQVYIQSQRAAGTDWHLSKGLQVVGLGHLPMNKNGDARIEFPLGYLDTSFAGQQLSVRLWDAEGVEPIYFYFDTIAKTDWIACFSDNVTRCTETAMQGPAGGQIPGPGAPNWTNAPPYGGSDQFTCSNRWCIYNFTVPSDFDPTHPMPFYGGRLYVNYQTGNTDTFGWWIVAQGRPVLVQ